MELGACVVREVAKMSATAKQSVTYDPLQRLFRVQLPGALPFWLDHVTVRQHDSSAVSINEWTGERLGVSDVSADIQPQGVVPLGNYAVQITWEDGFNQVAPFELLDSLRSLAVEPAAVEIGGLRVTAELSG